MDNLNYVQKINTLVMSIQLAALQEGMVSDADLDEMDRTLELADAIGFIYEPPVDWPDKVRNIEGQKGLIALHRKVRAFAREHIRRG